MPTNHTTVDNAPNAQTGCPSVRVGITQGDTNGVGPEVILKAFSDSLMLELCTPVVYGNAKVFAYHGKTLGLNANIRQVVSAEDAAAGQLNFVNCSDAEVKVEFGAQSAEAGHAAFVALEQAVQDLQSGLIDVLVTAPIQKASIQSSNFRFPGHTEYLQDRLGSDGGEPLMILCNPLMRVALVTTHLPISEVAFAITEDRIVQKARMLYESLCRDFNISSPRIAILALNPHAGDSSVIGHEEEEVIVPAIKSLADAGLPCYGPFPADGFFNAAMYRHFDAVLAMYHDQGLAPFKALTDHDGVNFTAGLPFVRTSPDHGTAYDIAGKNQADAQSFRQAVYSAIDIWRNRQAYDEAHANPLPKIFQDRREK